MPLFIYKPVYFLLITLARVAALFHPKIKKGFQLRAGTPKPWLKYPENSQPLWFHCASGEFEYAKPVIREIKKNWPHQKVLVTFFSPSVKPSLEKVQDVDFFCPLPWDKMHEFDEFIKHHNPKALLIARTDLWPMMIQSCVKNNLPRLLFSKTVNIEKSDSGKWVEKKLMKKLSAIFCVSEDDRKLLAKSLRGFSEIHAAGDTRYDQCLFRLKQPRPLKPLNNFHRPIFIAGSSWEKDEETFLPLIKTFKNDMSFIIAPHEPTQKHLTQLTQKIEKLGGSWSFYSQTQSWNPTDVLIIDQVGILADLYAWAQFSFIGGSMERSVHSVMESLAHGCLTFVGPHHKNNREAIQFQNEEIDQMAAVQVIRKTSELESKIQNPLNQWGASQKHQLKLLVEKRLGASQIVTKWIRNNTDLS